MKKIQVLAWGVQHIAANHKVECDVDYQEYMSMSIYGDSAPTLADTRMLCEDLGIDRSCCNADHSWGIIAIDVDEWAETIGQEEYAPTGMELWKKHGVEIGS